MEKEIKKFTVIDKDGTERQFEFQKCLDFDPLSELICDAYCPYRESCEKFKDPRDTKDKNNNFSDFCSELDEDEEKRELLGGIYMPAPGSLEKGFKDMED